MPYLVALFILVNLAATYRTVRLTGLTTKQKLIFVMLIWLLPLLGLFVALSLGGKPRQTNGRAPLAGSIFPNQPGAPETTDPDAHLRKD